MAKTVFFEEKHSKNAALILFDAQGMISTKQLGAHTTIGRYTGQSSCDIQIPSPLVSRTHSEILVVNGEYHYRDSNSTNGTYINNVLIGQNPLASKAAAILKDGDVLCFDIRKDGQSHPQCAYALFATNWDGADQWDKLALTPQIAEVCIGRSDHSVLQIDNEMISEKHASFFCASNGWAIIDHQSTNGVFLNGKKMSSPRYLKPYDVVRIVNTYFIYTGQFLLYSGRTAKKEQKAPMPIQEPVIPPVTPAAPRCTGELVIRITERSVFQRFKKLTLLQDINITVSNGEMVLILGGSGAGKTTFINAVMGYEKATGKITYKDTDIYAEYEQMKYEIGFVPQEDLLRGSDSVYDTLSNAAEMKLPRSVDDDARDQRIDQVLDQLGLSREKETLVSKLSGGQRKRLSIAVELISNPSLFFLDEPDSGVDDIMGRGLMENLRTIADQGKIVMVITHSPERAADLFDKVLVLAKSTKDNCGHLAFYGSVTEAFRFFEVSCFREIVKKINRPDENGEGLSDYFIDKYAAYSKR